MQGPIQSLLNEYLFMVITLVTICGFYLFMLPPVSAQSSCDKEKVCGIQKPPALVGRKSPLNLQEFGKGKGIDLRHGISQGKRPQSVYPFGERLYMALIFPSPLLQKNHGQSR
jgi:hypothetical protein